MAITYPDIRSVLDIEEWQKLQDQLAKVTGTAIITIDYKGTPVSKGSGSTDFCAAIRSNPVSHKRCRKCGAMGGLEAVRNGKPFIFLCHCGLVNTAVPIVIGDRYLGAVVVSQVRITNDDTVAKVEHLMNEITDFDKENDNVREDLLEKYNRLPLMEYSRVEEIADFIEAGLRYIINRDMKRINEKLQLEYSLTADRPPVFDGGTGGDAVPDGLSKLSQPPLREEYTEADSTAEKEVSMWSPVYPAVSYLFSHRDEMPSMAEMAKLCHLSPSYFSRVFTRELGENYTGYMHRLKVNWAKELLRGPQTVGQIALQLGYQDSSYFIKIFKRVEGITPTAYVKALRRK